MKKLGYIIAAAVLVVLLALFLQVGKIEVSGNLRYLTDEIIAVSELPLGGSLLVFDGAGATTRIFEAFPFIDSVSYRRKFPDTLIIEVVESSPVTRVELADASPDAEAEAEKLFALIDPHGKVLQITTATEDTILLTSIEISPELDADGESLAISEGNALPVASGDAEKLSYALEIIAELQVLGLYDNVTQLNADILNPTFDYEHKLTVEMGKREETAGKLDFFRRIYPTLDYGYGTKIDLSVVGEAHYIP
jgi:hypothetical protein